MSEANLREDGTMAIALEEAKEILDPFLDRLFACINGAVKDYQAKNADEKAILRPRTRAGWINDYMVHRALSELDLPGVRVKWYRGQFILIIRDQLRIRLKKLDHRLRPSNIPTKQSLSFLNQEQPRFDVVDEPPPLTDLVAGYQWNELETSVGVWIVCPNQRTNQWALEVGDPTKMAAVLTHPESASAAAPRRTRVRPKAPPEVKSSGDEGNG